MNSLTKLIVFTILLFFSGSMIAQVKLPKIYSNNMVLQQGIEIPVRGWASPGEKVTVTINKTTVYTKADKTGKWNLKLPAIDE